MQLRPNCQREIKWNLFSLILNPISSQIFCFQANFILYRYYFSSFMRCLKEHIYSLYRKCLALPWGLRVCSCEGGGRYIALLYPCRIVAPVYLSAVRLVAQSFLLLPLFASRGFLNASKFQQGLEGARNKWRAVKRRLRRWCSLVLAEENNAIVSMSSK